ncbi:alkaline phosphatase D family protein [Halovenus marina]|uniref:alkaline phosphatase D family protein n=1 Tax=Halovenus marina TaxID=3396621 RepID=UPI003F57D27E
MDEDGQARSGSLQRRQLLTAVAGASTLAGCTAALVDDETEATYGFNNGLKIGDVTDTSAIVWTRLSRDTDTPWWNRRIWFPPTDGTVQLGFWPEEDPTEQRQLEQRAESSNDGTVHFRLTDLEPATNYRVAIRAEPDEADGELELDGRFRTAPDETMADPVNFAVVSCQAWRFQDTQEPGFETYKTLTEMDPSFFVHTGDMVYYDQGSLRGRTIATARTHWHRLYSLDLLREFHRSASCYLLKDDHDITSNDCWPGQSYGNLSFDDGVAIFNEQNPIGDSPYKTVRWGQDLQIWLLEMREFRSPNTIPDGPGKTILGNEQIRWLKETIDESDAAFRVVIAPSIFVGPDKPGKNDNYANEGFSYESQILREFLSSRNVVVVGGDRHWQYVSVDAETGLWEFGSGALARGREGGWTPGDRRSEHRFLAVKPGFIWGTVDREDGEPILTIEHRSRFGRIRNTEQFTANPVEHRG